MSMFPIATLTVTTSSSQLTFSVIPQTFTHLQARIFGRDATSAATFNPSFVQINGFGSTYPNYHAMGGNGSTTFVSSAASVLIPLPNLASATAAANVVGSSIVDILDYSNTNKNKTVRAIGGVDLNGSGEVSITSGFLNSTSAITSLTFGGAFNSPFAFANGTRVDLYGISTSNETGA
jgi:hypothetical protein